MAALAIWRFKGSQTPRFSRKPGLSVVLAGALLASLAVTGCAGDDVDPADDSTASSTLDTAVDSGAVIASDVASDIAGGSADAADAVTQPVKQCTDDAQCQLADLCAGQGFCQKSTGLWRCAIKPGSAVVCDSTADTPCSSASCSPKTGTCEPTFAVDGTPCSVEDPCTVSASCAKGTCTASGPSWCQCQANADCAALNKDNLCAGSWFCAKEVFPYRCELNTAAAVTCDPSKSTDCGDHTCDPKTGACALLPKPDGVPCDDGNPQSLGDACKAGSCQGGAKVFNCSADKDCDSLEDGDLCNGVLFCDVSDKLCKVNPQTKISCPTAGDTACNVNTCDPTTGACNFVAAKNGTACDDANPCTQGDLCLTGTCAPGAKFVCTCKTDADCVSYDDGDLCNGTFYCDGATKSCAFDKTSVKVCQTVDDTACQKSACLPKTGGCEPTPTAQTVQVCGLNGDPAQCRTAVKPAGAATATTVKCDDGDACTGNDLCAGAKCVGNTKICHCQTNADCLKEDDGDACNGVPFCDKSGATPKCVDNPASVVVCPKHQDTACLNNVCKKHNGLCVLEPANTNKPCDDGDSCTAKTACTTGKCGGGSAADCGDGNACTTDSCTAATGCLHKAGNCDDGNDCTVDSCAPKTGKCTFLSAPQQGKGCIGDNDGCTVNDVCDAGVCKTGPKIVCKIATGPCEKATCSSLGANNHSCVAVPQADKQPCDDGDPCVLGAKCKSGVCATGDRPRLFARKWTSYAEAELTAAQSVAAGTLMAGTYLRTWPDGKKHREWLLRVADETGFGGRLIAVEASKPGGAGSVVGVAEISPDS